MEERRKALVEKLKTLSPERFEAVCWLMEHWTILKARSQTGGAGQGGIPAEHEGSEL